MSDLEFDFLVNDAAQPRCTFVLAHGAGQGMDAPFMTEMAEALSARQINVVRFEFRYMQTQRRTGKRRAPDRAPVLCDTWRAVIAAQSHTPLVIGGKSMGGRIASMVADESNVGALVCLGYPFHPPGKPENLRTAHLEELQTPMLIVQGERDTFGKREEVAGYTLSSNIKLCWLPDGDHSFKPRKSSGHTVASNMALTVDAIDAFLSEQGW